MTHTHFIGIGGTGLSAIARVLLERGEKVSGSDREDSPITSVIESAGAKVYISHDPDNIQGADVIVRSSAVPDENVEVQAGIKLGIPVLKRVDYMEQLMADHLTVAVAGSHGKTTTTSMIAWVLSAMNQDPSFIVGSNIVNLETNAHAGKGQVFVIEADEYDHMFLGLNPDIAVVTNVEYDHPDFFTSPEDFYAAFRSFVDRLTPTGKLIASIDDPGARQLSQEATENGKQTINFGILDGKSPSKSISPAEYQALNLIVSSSGGVSFDAHKGDTHLAHLDLIVPGRHNVLNALAALIVIDLLGLFVTEAASALNDFRGASRRFEVVGEVSDIIVIDDYAHHPTEIRATLSAARDRYPMRTIWAVWQPHTFSRTHELLADYAEAFADADRVVVTAVYAARESQPEDFSHQEIIKTINHSAAQLIPDLEQVAAYVLEHLKTGDIVLVLSAGDAVKVSAQIVAALQTKEGQHA